MHHLRRPKQGRIIGGVCAGIAQRFNIDASLVRIGFALTLLPGGVPGLVLYVICWLIIPSE